MRKHRLFTPGPTPVPTESLLTMARPIDHHRLDEAVEAINEVRERLKVVFQTRNDVMILTSSGTGGLEAAVVNLLSPGDRAIVIRGGKFGERWGEICRAYGIETVPIDLEWGRAVDPTDVERLLKEHGDVKAVFATLCETSTGVLHDVRTLAEITGRTEALLVVDAVSALGADELRMDRWGVNAVISSSQKGLMTPPGLAFVSFDEKAWRMTERSTLPKYYLDLRKARESGEKGSTPFTPAITLIIGLRESLRMIAQEGFENVLARHARLARATRAAAEALGLELFAERPANTVTAIKMPDGIDGVKFVRMMRSKYGITYAGGQEKLKGKIFRIAHLGWMDEFDVLTAVGGLELGLKEMGYPVKPGAGVAAAMEALM
jgi:aspartate aminotransferase-like enzyme